MRHCPMCRQNKLTQQVKDLSRQTCIQQCKDEFLKKLQTGDEVDAQDCDGVWYASRIIQVDKVSKKWLVHYYGWSEKWEEWVVSDRIYPLHTHTTNWIQMLRPCDPVDYKKENTQLWYRGVVEKVDKKNSEVHVFNQNKVDVVPLNVDMLAPAGTHSNSFMWKRRRHENNKNNIVIR